MDPNRPHQHPSRSTHQYDRPFPLSHTQGTERETDVRQVLSRRGTESEEGEEESPASSRNVARNESQNTGTGDESPEDQGSPQHEDSDSDAIMENPRDSGSDYLPSSSSPVDEEAALTSDHLGSAAENQGTVEHHQQAPASSISAPATSIPPPSMTYQGGGSQAWESLPAAGLGEQNQGYVSGSGNRFDQEVLDPSIPHNIHNRGRGFSYLYEDSTSTLPRRQSYFDSRYNTMDPTPSAAEMDDVPDHQLRERLAPRFSNRQGESTVEEVAIGNDDDQGPQENAPPAASYAGVGNPAMGSTPASPNASSLTQLPRTETLPGAQYDRYYESIIDQTLRTRLPAQKSVPRSQLAPSTGSQNFQGSSRSIHTFLHEERLRRAAREQAGQSQSQSALRPSGDRVLGAGQPVPRPPYTRSSPYPRGNNERNPRVIVNQGNRPLRGPAAARQPFQYPSPSQDPGFAPARHPATPGHLADMPSNQPFRRLALPPYRNPDREDPDNHSPLIVSEAPFRQAQRNIAEAFRQQQDRLRAPHPFDPISSPFPSTHFPNQSPGQQYIDPLNRFNDPRLRTQFPGQTHGFTPLPSGQSISMPQQRPPSFDQLPGTYTQPRMNYPPIVPGAPPPFVPGHGTPNQSRTNNPPMAPQQPVLPPAAGEYNNTPYAVPDTNNDNDVDDVLDPPRPRVPIRGRSPVQRQPVVPPNTESWPQRQPPQRLRDYQSHGAQNLAPLVEENRHLATTDVAPNVNDADPGKSDFEPTKMRAWCRMHAENGFQVSEQREGPWRNAIRHDTIRGPLLDYATRQYGPWTHPRERGSHALDRTSVHPDQQSWIESDRRTWPDILFQFERRPNEELEHTEPQGEWMWGNRVVVDRNNRPLTIWPRLNTCCSTKFEGWAMEALLRMCTQMTPLDIWQRTMRSSKKQKDPGRTAYNARRERFRKSSGLIAWTQRPGSQAIKEATRKAMGEWGRQNSSTRDFRGFTEAELAKIKKDSKTSRRGSKTSTNPESDDEPEVEPEENDEDENEGEAEGKERDPQPEEDEDEDEDEDPDVIDVDEDAY